jgi:hypothetical protein
LFACLVGWLVVSSGFSEWRSWLSPHELSKRAKMGVDA